MTEIEREERLRNKLFSIKSTTQLTDENIIFLLQCLGDTSWRVRKEAIELAVNNPTEKIVTMLIKALSSDDNAGLRNAAQEALTLIGNQVINPLIDHFPQADNDVKKFIIDILGDIRSCSVCDFLIQTLKESDENVLIAACENIGKLGCKNAVMPLLSILNSQKQWLSFVIIESLAQIGEPFNAEKILPLWDVPQLRKPILDLLSLINTPDNIKILKKAFLDSSNFIKINATNRLYTLFNKDPENLKHLKHALKDCIRYSDIYLKLFERDYEEQNAFALLTYISEDEQFFKNFVEKGSDESLEFFGTLSSFATFENTDIIEKSLSCFDNKRQAYLIYLCGLFKVESAFNKLVSFCESEFGHSRQAVAFSLGRLGNKAAIDCLLKLISDPYTDVREQAVNSLAMLISAETFPYNIAEEIFREHEKEKIISLLDLMDKTDALKDEYIIRALRSPEALVREKALQIIGKRQLKNMLEEISFYLTDENEDVRIKAIEAIGNIGNESSIVAISGFLTSDSFQIRKTTIESIYNISPAKLPLYEEHIYKNLTPFSFIELMSLLEKGLPLNPEFFIKAALKIDEKDIFVELIQLFKKLGLNERAEQLVNLLNKEKGTNYLPNFLKNNYIPSGD